jgi:hypothetical protein
MDRTPESQAVVVAAAIKSLFPRTTRGKGKNEHTVIVRGATAKDRGTITREAKRFSTGFTLDVRHYDGFYTIKLEVPSGEKAPAWDVRHCQNSGSEEGQEAYDL